MTYGTVNADLMTTSDGVSAAGLYGFKNRIINGDMRIDQRNVGAAVTIPATTGTYVVDRWYGYAAAASKFTLQQNAGAITPPSGFSNYLGATVAAAANVTVGSTDLYGVLQPIEGFNIADLAWGTASAATVTLSFRVYSSLTGTFGGALLNNAQNRAYPFTYSVPVANTWTTISITIAGDTTGTWLTNNSTGILVCLSLGSGSSKSAAAGTWAAGAYTSATGAVNIISTNSATFYVTGIQLERGSTATSYDFRDYGRELILCQRYYEAMDVVYFTLGWASVANQAYWKVTKRSIPTVLGNYPQGGTGGIFNTFGSSSPFAPSCSQLFQTVANSTPSGGYVTGSSEL